MTATIGAPVQDRTSRAAGRAAPLAAWRLLRVELRRSAMPWILPLLAALFWFDCYRFATGQPAFWVLRTFWSMGQGHAITDLGPFVAGVAAWIGSRDGRRGTVDLVTSTPRPRWTAQLATCAATTIWAVAAYLIFVGVLFGVYSRAGLAGSPPWWWAADGAAAMIAFSVAGFAAGAFFPSRFTAGVVAFGGFLAMFASFQLGFGHASGWALILPTNSNGNYQLDSGIYYPWLNDLPIARVIFLAGIAVAAAGLLGLPARAGGRWLRRAAAAVTAAGVAAAGTGVALADTARLEPHGIVIQALHDAASDRPVSYTPVCGQAAGIPVCLHPAYRRFMSEVTADLRPVLSEIAGLPGAPARISQVAAAYTGGNQGDGVMTIGGSPPVLSMPLGAYNLPGEFNAGSIQLQDQLQLLSLHAFVGAGNDAGTPAQQAAQAALWQQAGMPFIAQPIAQLYVPWGGHRPVPLPPSIQAAAARLAALPYPALRAWFASHLGALRSGRLTLGQLP